MNRTLSDLQRSSVNDLHQIQKYDSCRQESKCYLLAPPPRPPTIPELFLTRTCQLSSSSSSSTLTHVRARTDSSYLTFISIILGILIALTFTCLLLFLLGFKFQFYHKLRYRHRRTTGIDSANSSIREASNSDVAFIKTTHANGNAGSVGSGGGGGDGCASFSSAIPVSYDCVTPLTTTTTATHNQYPSLSMTHNSNSSLHMMHSQLHSNSDETSSSMHNSANVYEEIRPQPDMPRCCCCCSCTLAHYQQQQQQHFTSTNRQMLPHYYTCEPAPPALSSTSAIVCQTCLLETLHRKQRSTSKMNCACRNFFIPIK